MLVVNLQASACDENIIHDATQYEVQWHEVINIENEAVLSFIFFLSSVC